MWVYRSPIGNLYIQRQPDSSYGLLYRGTVWESCSTPEAEADNVRAHCTGCDAWDQLGEQDCETPFDLSDWELV